MIYSVERSRSRKIRTEDLDSAFALHCAPVTDSKAVLVEHF